MGVNNGTNNQGCINQTVSNSNGSAVNITNGMAGTPADAVKRYKGRITLKIIGLDIPAEALITVLRAIKEASEDV